MVKSLTLDQNIGIHENIVAPVNYTVIIHPAEEGGFWAKCPQLPGCFTQGESLREIQANMYEAVELWLEDEPETKDYLLSFEVKHA